MSTITIHYASPANDPHKIPRPNRDLGMSARFKIERHAIDAPVRAPWALKDRARPAFVRSYSTHAKAILAADNIVRRERGMPDRLDISVAEIIDAMHTIEATA